MKLRRSKMARERLSKINTPDGNKYNLSVPYIVGTGSTAGTWLGALDDLTAYYDGLLILYKPSVAGASTTTLNINSIGGQCRLPCPRPRQSTFRA